MLLEGIILNSVLQIKNNRSINSIYYLLSGKRSVQTVQDAHIYEIENFFGIFHTLEKSEFDRIVKQLLDDKRLISDQALENTYLITSVGKKWLTDYNSKIPYDYFNGIKYIEIDRIFYARLLLLIQVLTNRKMKNSTYIPVIDQISITSWVTQIYQKLKNNVDDSLKRLYTELHHLLLNFSEVEATIFVCRLTGYKQYGMSINQLASKHNMSVSDVQLLLIGMVHRLLNLITSDQQEYEFMSVFVSDLSMTGFISQSARRTRSLLDKQYDLKTISQLRRLKMNTIYDHIVEIALADTDFVIDPYVTIKDQHDIIEVYQRMNSTKLKEIKKNVNEDISYFQIKLVLAASQHKLE